MSLIIRHLTIIFALSIGSHLQAQQWQLDQATPPEVTITGTSTLHDWTVTCAEVKDVPNQLTVDPSNAGEIADFGFKVPVTGMDGGRGSSMNEKINNAFQSSEHPVVEYKQTAPAKVSQANAAGEFTIQSTGTLFMAGASKPVQINCTGVTKDDKLVITGNQELKMSEFGMTPPSAMFGQIKTNDNIVVNYKFQYLKK